MWSKLILSKILLNLKIFSGTTGVVTKIRLKSYDLRNKSFCRKFEQNISNFMIISAFQKFFIDQQNSTSQINKTSPVNNAQKTFSCKHLLPERSQRNFHYFLHTCHTSASFYLISFRKSFLNASFYWMKQQLNAQRIGIRTEKSRKQGAREASTSSKINNSEHQHQFLPLDVLLPFDCVLNSLSCPGQGQLMIKLCGVMKERKHIVQRWWFNAGLFRFSLLPVASITSRTKTINCSHPEVIYDPKRALDECS